MEKIIYILTKPHKTPRGWYIRIKRRVVHDGGFTEKFIGHATFKTKKAAEEFIKYNIEQE